MKKLYQAPAMKVAIIRNEDVLTMISGDPAHDGLGIENSQSKVKDIYDFTSRFGG